MSGIEELQTAIRHVTQCTGDPGAWRVGLSPSDLTDLTMLPVDARVAGVVLTKLRGLHPTLFDPRTGEPVSPPPKPQGAPPNDTSTPDRQDGATIDAIATAEQGLAKQNSATAQLDLHAITAILNAHSTNTEGGQTLARLQHEIEAAVRARTDLDTPAGAKDFQRFLIGKLRDIRNVIETASLAGSSRAALLAACTALYDASANPPDAAPDEQADATRPGPSPTRGDSLPPYGADEFLSAASGTDPLLDQFLAADPALLDASAPGQVAPPGPLPGPIPMFPPSPAFGGGSAPSPAAPSDSVPYIGAPGGSEAVQHRASPLSGGLDDSARYPSIPIDELLAGDLGPETDRPGEPSTEQEDPVPEKPEPDSAGSATTPEAHLGVATVRLPDGEVVAAANPQLAAVIGAAVNGTPVAEAFHQHGITIPPAGTAVERPVDPARLTPGDIGMFTDRHALVVGTHKAVLNGQIQPITSVTGPSFLGWEHPPAPGPTAASPTPTSPAPTSATTPTPTRPATTGIRS